MSRWSDGSALPRAVRCLLTKICGQQNMRRIPQGSLKPPQGVTTFVATLLENKKKKPYFAEAAVSSVSWDFLFEPFTKRNFSSSLSTALTEIPSLPSKYPFIGPTELFQLLFAKQIPAVLPAMPITSHLPPSHLKLGSLCPFPDTDIVELGL